LLTGCPKSSSKRRPVKVQTSIDTACIESQFETPPTAGRSCQSGGADKIILHTARQGSHSATLPRACLPHTIQF
ncbi:MAG: hypothetical protein PHQ41_02345, partial [Candidatus Cloacimonetes bacterium]|nr:hypothetical protein [Candidatus Cloacimonadota bacterium]